MKVDAMYEFRNYTVRFLLRRVVVSTTF